MINKYVIIMVGGSKLGALIFEFGTYVLLKGGFIVEDKRPIYVLDTNVLSTWTCA